MYPFSPRIKGSSYSGEEFSTSQTTSPKSMMAKEEDEGVSMSSIQNSSSVHKKEDLLNVKNSTSSNP